MTQSTREFMRASYIYKSQEPKGCKEGESTSNEGCETRLYDEYDIPERQLGCCLVGKEGEERRYLS